MPFLHVHYVNTHLIVVVTKGYEDVVKETITEVLQSFFEKVRVTKIDSSSSKCGKFLFKFASESCGDFIGYPSNSSSNFNLDVQELHVALLEEMRKVSWVWLRDTSVIEGKWTFQMNEHIANGTVQ